jgi:uncharacterized membrane protein (DUF373 family)
MNFFSVIFKHSVSTPQEIQFLHIIKTGKIMLLRQIIVVYSENHAKQIHHVGKLKYFLMLKEVVHIIIIML